MQLSVNSSMPGLQRGMLVGFVDPSGVVSRFNSRSETRTITVTYSASQTHTLVVAGTPHGGGAQQTASVTVSSTTDSATTAALLLAAIRASAVQNAIVSATIASNVITLVARRAGSLTVTGSATGGGATTVATTVSEEQLEAGVAVVMDTSADKSVRKPFTGTAQVDTLSFTGVNAYVYTFLIDILTANGDVDYTQAVDFTGDGSATAAEAATGLAARINELDVPVTGAVATNDLTLTADVAGQGFTVREASANITVAHTTANVTNIFEGVTLWPKVEDSSQALTSNNVWPSRYDVSVMKRGRIGAYVESAVTPSSPVYYRAVASGALTVLGAFAGAAGTGLIRLRGAKFETTAAAGGVAELFIR